MSKFRDILKFLVSFFLMFTIIIMQISFFTNVKLLNSNFYKDTLNKNDYFSLMRKDIDYGFKNLSMITSIPEKIFINSVSDKSIIQLSNKDIDNAESYMKNNTTYISSKTDTKPIYNNLETYAKTSNINIDSNLKNQLLVVSKDAGSIIDNYAILFNISVVDKYPQFQSFKKLVHFIYSIKIISVILVLLMVMLLALLNRKNLRGTFLWVGSSFIPASMMTLIPCILALYYKVPSRFAIDSPYLKVALRNISLGYINFFIVTGVIVLLIGISCMCIYTYLNNKAYRKNY